jgi:hypothetical protein
MNGRKFRTSMLEYGKIVLTKISFDRKLFRKEYKKIIRLLQPNEQRELKSWVRAGMNLA